MTVPPALPPEIPLETHSTEAAEEPTIAEVTRYWCSLNNGHPPARTAFEFMDIYKQAPNLLMSERVAPQTFSFIYCGTAVADNFPLDLTGKTFGPDNVEASRIPWFNYKSAALDTPCIRYGKDDFDWPNRRFDIILSAVFPLSDDTGDLRYALACLVFVDTGNITPLSA